MKFGTIILTCFMSLTSHLTTFLNAQPVSPCLLSSGLVDEANRKPSNQNNPYIENACYEPIARYLASAYTMRDLTTLISPTERFGSSAGCDQQWSGWGRYVYCPEKYCQDIKFLVDNKIEFVADAAGKWCDNISLFPNAYYQNAIRQSVIDVNAAYDCANLRRPIIQASIFECVDGNTGDRSSNLNAVPIAKETVDMFKNEIDFSESAIIGYSSNDIRLTFNQIVGATSGAEQAPDITNVFGKIWIMHQAKLYIDAGYKALHLGDIVQRMNRKDTNKTYHHLHRLLKTIREYASIKGSFVLLNCENPRLDSWPPLVYNINGRIERLFDFDNIALRVQEVANPAECNEYPLNRNYIGTPCENNPYNGVVNVCWIKARQTPPAYASNGCYVQNSPTLLYFDSGDGIKDESHRSAYETYGADAARYGEKGIWGWDDLAWFGNLNTTCQEHFVRDAMCKLGNIEKNLFLLVPHGRQFPRNLSSTQPLFERFEFTNRHYLIKDAFFKGTSTHDFTINPTVSSILFDYSFSCNNQTAPQGYIYQLSMPTIKLNVSNPDCRSIYSFHIQQNNSFWYPFTFGKQRTVIFEQLGDYNISLRIDNASLMPFGSNSISKRFTATPFCKLVKRKRGFLKPEKNNFTTDGLSLFPTIVDNSISIKGLDESSPTTKVEILNIMGVLLRTYVFKSDNHITINDLSDLSKGTYLVKVTDEMNQDILKFIKL